MRWVGLIGGALLAWVLLEVMGTPGPAFMVLCAVVGVVVASLRGEVSALRAEVQRLDGVLSSELNRLRQAPAEASAPVPNVPVAAAPVFGDIEPKPDVAEDDTWAQPEKASRESLPPTQPAPQAQRELSSNSADVSLEVDEDSTHITTSLGQSIMAWFKGGNTIVRVAVVLLFIGVAFLLRYAAEHSLLPLELRMAAVAAGGLALAVVGWRLRESRRGYGLSLQGAGVGIVYLTLFAAFRLYGLVPAPLTFALLAMMALVTALLAVRQNAMPLALLGFGGGFLAPVLASTGSGSHVALFSYYLVLNVAIAWIAQRQTWKPLNLMAFLFTFGIGSAWGAKSYAAPQFWSTEPFLVIHFLLFLYISVQYTRQLVAEQDSQAKALPTVDASLLFGVPIAAFGLQAAMLKDQPWALAMSAAVMAGIYLLVGRWLWKASGQRMMLMVEGLLALGVIFLLLVTPLALDAQWTGVAWAIQGAGIVWLGLRQKRWWAAGMGLLMQLGAAVSFWGVSGQALRWNQAFTPFANTVFVSALVLAVAALFTAWLAHRESPLHEQRHAQVLQFVHLGMLVLGIVQWLAAFWPELRVVLGPKHDPAGLVLMFLAFGGMAWAMASRLAWPALHIAARVLWLVAVVSSLVVVTEAHNAQTLWEHYVHRGHGAIAAFVIAVVLVFLRRAEPAATTAELLAPAWAAMLHGGMLAYAALAQGVARHEGWAASAAVAVPTAMALWWLGRARNQAWPAPLAQAGSQWRFLHLPWLAVLTVWMLGANALSDGSMQPLPYLPMFNPTDLMHALAAYYAVRLYLWAQAAVPDAQRSGVWIKAGAAMVFIWLNGLLVRSLHHWADTPMWLDGALGADAVQTGFTMLWTACAFLTMWWATRKAQRTVWMAGAALLAVVVGKLFFVDLSQVGTLARIVSFMGVGGLMLVIGYLSPMPPAQPEMAKEGV
jgi:uncharacterized membrane protein